MSTRSTLVWSKDPDGSKVSHVWQETGRGNEEVAEGDIVMDLTNAQVYGIEVDEEGVSFVVKAGSDLHQALMRIR